MSAQVCSVKQYKNQLLNLWVYVMKRKLPTGSNTVKGRVIIAVASVTFTKFFIWQIPSDRIENQNSYPFFGL